MRLLLLLALVACKSSPEPSPSIVSIAIAPRLTIVRRDHERTVTLSIHASGAQLAKARATIPRELPAGYRLNTRF